MPLYKLTNRNKTKQLDDILLSTDILTLLTVAEESANSVQPLPRQKSAS